MEDPLQLYTQRAGEAAYQDEYHAVYTGICMAGSFVEDIRFPQRVCREEVGGWKYFCGWGWNREDQPTAAVYTLWFFGKEVHVREYLQRIE